MTESFRRNQLEWALWQLFAGNTPAENTPKVFRNRIKRLLDIDRDLGPRDDLDFSFAYFDDEGPGLGAEVEYSAYCAFALALGLDLLDAGFKQSEVVELCRACRPKLERQFRAALKNPPAPAEHIPAEDRPGCPTYRWGDIDCADCWIFLVMQKIELIESLPATASRGKKKAVLLEPGFYRGRQALHKELDSMPSYYRKAFVMEIAETADLVRRHLETAPLVKRGRK